MYDTVFVVLGGHIGVVEVKVGLYQQSYSSPSLVVAVVRHGLVLVSLCECAQWRYNGEI